MNKFIEKKISLSKKAVLCIFLIFFMMFSPFTTPRAHAWMSIPAAIFKQLLENIVQYIEDTIIAVLKNAGAQVVNQLSTKLIMGGDSGPLVITNWEDYLIKGAEKNAKILLNDSLVNSCNNRNSSLAYEPASGNEGIGADMYNLGVGAYTNYCTRVTEAAKAEAAQKTRRPTYQRNPSTALNGTNLKQQSELMSGSNPAVAQMLAAASNQESLYKDQKDVLTLQALSSGFLPKKDKSGNVIAPSKTVADTVGSTLNLGNQMLANADSIPGVLTALAVKLVTETFTKGVGNLATKMAKEVNGVQNQAKSQVKNQINTSGPGAQYKR